MVTALLSIQVEQVTCASCTVMHSPLNCKGNTLYTRSVYACMLPYFQLCILQFFRKFFPVRSGSATPIGTPFKQLLEQMFAGKKVVKIYMMVWVVQILCQLKNNSCS